MALRRNAGSPPAVATLTCGASTSILSAVIVGIGGCAPAGIRPRRRSSHRCASRSSPSVPPRVLPLADQGEGARAGVLSSQVRCHLRAAREAWSGTLRKSCDGSASGLVATTRSRNCSSSAVVRGRRRVERTSGRWPAISRHREPDRELLDADARPGCEFERSFEAGLRGRSRRWNHSCWSRPMRARRQR